MSIMEITANFMAYLMKKKTTVIDNKVFQLYYCFTSPLLIILSALLTSKHLMGETIACATRQDGLHTNSLISSYCLSSGTYTIRYKEDIESKLREYTREEKQFISRFGGIRQEIGQAHPGLGPSLPLVNYKVYHTTFSWVYIILIVQSLLFYIPIYFWKIVEGGKIKLCIQNVPHPEDNNEIHIRKMNKMVHTYNKLKRDSNIYTIKYFIFEVLNLFILIGNGYINNLILQKRFISLGLDIFSYYRNIDKLGDDNMFNNPLYDIFPTVTKCDFYIVSTVGQIDNFDVMCHLPVNRLNEKIFIVIWYWFFILSFLSVTSIITATVRIVLDGKMFGEKFMRQQISKNVDTVIFEEFISKIPELTIKDKKINAPSRYLDI